MDQSKLNELAKATESWAKNFEGDQTHSNAADDESMNLKKQWLNIVDQLKTDPKNKEFSKLVDEINSNDSKIREQISQLAYEGRVTQKELQKILEENTTLPDYSASNGCPVCATCSTCATCSACLACIISGVVALGITSSISTISTTSTYAN